MDPKPSPTEPTRWLIDGYNVLHAGMLPRDDRSHWWTRAHRDRLARRVARLKARAREIWVAFDGDDEGERTPAPAATTAETTPVRIVFARSADAWILEGVRQASCPEECVVVTADRKVADKARHRGAHIVSPRALCVTHMFNHQTHHRGQVHAMMTAAGLEAPVSEMFAEEIGADGYAADASSAVDLFKEVYPAAAGA